MLLGLLRRGGGAEHHGVVVQERGDAAGGLAGQTTGLETDRASAERAVIEHGLGCGEGTLHGKLLRAMVASDRTRADIIAPMRDRHVEVSEAIALPGAVFDRGRRVVRPGSHYRGPTDRGRRGVV